MLYNSIVLLDCFAGVINLIKSHSVSVLSCVTMMNDSLNVRLRKGLLPL